MRRGFRTTEFWAVVAVGLGNLAASLSGQLAPRYASMASAAAVGLYAVGRGLAKLAAAGGPDQAPRSPSPAPVPSLPPPVQAP